MKSACGRLRSRNGEKGQALPLVLIVVLIGTVVTAPFVINVGTSLLSSRTFDTRINEQFSTDSGVEHGIWRLVYGGLTSQLTRTGDNVSYNLAEQVNGAIPAVTVCNAWETIASDNFESGGWSGGTGWLAAWTHTGDSSVVTTGTPYQGSYHLMLRSNTGYVKRSADVRGPSARLQFWAKANSFEAGETARALISPNGTDWTVVRTWVEGDDDNTYHYYDIDLSMYALTSQFWVAFQANMADTADYFYVDSLKVVWQFNLRPAIAEDNFESGGWSGGTGWLAAWNSSGDASITGTGSPYEGSYHMLLQQNTGNVTRTVDLSQQTSARLQFWSKVQNYGAADTAQASISPDGINWTVVHTWTQADSDNTYHYNDLDLSSYTLSSEFWIRFKSNASNASKRLYIDALQIEGTLQYGVVSRAGYGVTKTVVKIISGVPTVLFWWLN